MTASTDGSGLLYSPEAAERLLAERATVLARPLPADERQAFIDMVVFSLCGQRYAVELGQVDAVFDVGAPVLLPGVPAFFLGLAHRRGLVFPVIDIGPFFGVAAAPQKDRRQALLIQSGGSAAALAADMLEGHQRARERDLAPMRGEASLHPSIRGLIGGDTLFFDAHQLLGEARLVVDDRPVQLRSMRDET